MSSKPKKLTVKEAKLVKGIAEGKKKRQAGFDAGYTGKPETVSVDVSKTLKKPNVQEALQVELARQGITLEQVVAPVTRALTDDSIETQLKGHDRAMKILGANQPREAPININFNQVVQKDKDEFGI